MIERQQPRTQENVLMLLRIYRAERGRRHGPDAATMNAQQLNSE